jgi:arylsulfatase A-like enzyme
MRNIPRWLASGGSGRDFRIREADERPDIVLFMTDEQRHDHVGYASGGHYETPALDRLAAEGVAFEAAYSGSTTCVPSRVSLLTGLHHHRTRQVPGKMALAEGQWTIARGLRAAGYSTALVGKMHFWPMYADHGFDQLLLAEHLVPYSGYGPGEVDDYTRFLLWNGRATHENTHLFGPGDDAARDEFLGNHFAVPFPDAKEFHSIGWIAGKAVEVLEKRRPEQPLLLVVSFPRPHAPYDPAEPYASMYAPTDTRVPDEGFDVNLALPEAFRRVFEHDAAQFFNPCPVTSLNAGVLRRVLTYERALVRQIDDAMAEVLARLDPRRSVVFFTSDHGTYGGHRGLVSKVPWVPFDDLARVPFVCRAPGALAGRRIAEPVQSFDFVPTCLDYAGVDFPDGAFDGENLRSVIEGYPAPAGRTVFSTGSQGFPMVRAGESKLIIGPGGAEIFFDLARDPGETRSLHEDPAQAPVLSVLRDVASSIMARPALDLPAAVPAR